MITAPRRFGKSVNLDMLRLFLELELNANGKEKANEDKENFKLFEKLHISAKKQVMKKHYGQYPIIFASFYTSDPVFSEEQALTICRNAIHRAYKRHEYLYKHDTDSKLKDDEKLHCKKWCTYPNYKSFERDDVVRGLKELSEYLFKFFNGKKVFVLIDEYDCIISNAMFKIKDSEIREKTLSLPVAIMGAVMKDNDDNLSGGVITGVLDMKGLLISSTMGNVTRYRFATSNLNVKFNGFLKNEVAVLFQKWKVSSELQDAAYNRYNTYYDLNGKEIYNPHSIVQFLLATQLCKLSPDTLENYWVKSGYVMGMEEMFRDSQVVKMINKMLQKEDVRCVVSTDLNLEALVKISEGLDIDDNATTASIFLLCQGYLTLSFTEQEEFRTNEGRPVCITNDDSAHELRAMMINYFHQCYQLDRKFSKLCSESFSKLPSLCEKPDLDDFKQELLKFQENFDILIETGKFVKPLNEATLYSILFAISLQAGLYFGQQKEPVQGRRLQLDVIIFLDTCGAVIELKLEDSTPLKALLQVLANRYYHIFTSGKYTFPDKTPLLSMIMGIVLNANGHFTISFIRKQELEEVVNELNVGENCEKLEERIDLALKNWHMNDDGTPRWFEKHMDDVTIQQFLKKCTSLP